MVGLIRFGVGKGFGNFDMLGHISKSLLEEQLMGGAIGEKLGMKCTLGSLAGGYRIVDFGNEGVGVVYPLG